MTQALRVQNLHCKCMLSGQQLQENRDPRNDLLWIDRSMTLACADVVMSLVTGVVQLCAVAVTNAAYDMSCRTKDGSTELLSCLYGRSKRPNL